ncbi:MAG: tetratricopeptide repeat protein [Deltaproteobacteria bacterium]|nr:tetratricopeptide repeat protein [Deltaproteobacteria bacterium]
MTAVAGTACVVDRRPDGDPGPRPERELTLPEIPTSWPAPPEAPSLPVAIAARRAAALERLRAGDVEAATAALEQLALDAGPTYTITNDLAIAHALRGDFARSLALADAALALHDGPEAGATRVEALLGLGDRVAAVDDAVALTRRHPGSAAAYYALGTAYWSLGNKGDARIAFESARDRAPDDWASAVAVFACASSDASAPEFEELGGQLLERSPDDPHVLYLMGAGKERRLEPEEAERLYRRSIAAAEARGRPFAWAHWNLAELLDEQRDEAAARPHYQAFLELAPPSAARERAEAKKKLGKR